MTVGTAGGVSAHLQELLPHWRPGPTHRAHVCAGCLTFNAFLLWHGMFSGLAAFQACVCDIVLTLFEFIIEDFISFTRGQVWDLHDTERFPVAGNYCAPSPLPPFLRGSEWAEVPAFVLCLCAQGC